MNSFTATNLTTGAINITVQPTALAGFRGSDPIGWRNVTITTGAEQVSLTRGFWLDRGPAVLTAVAPNYGAQGQTLVLNITGQDTHFVNGLTTASFSGSGINAGAVSVTNATSARTLII